MIRAAQSGRAELHANTRRLSDLYQVISENAPDAVRTGDIKSHFGRKVAIVRSGPYFSYLSGLKQANKLSLTSGCVRRALVSMSMKPQGQRGLTPPTQIHEYLQLPHRRPFRRPAAHERVRRDDITFDGHVLPYAPNGRQWH